MFVPPPPDDSQQTQPTRTDQELREHYSADVRAFKRTLQKWDRWLVIGIFLALGVLGELGALALVVWAVIAGQLGRAWPVILVAMVMGSVLIVCAVWLLRKSSRK
jgi:hypothetical protein